MGIDKTKIRDELLPEVRSYADNTPLADKDTLDCSLGINPYGFPDVVIDIVHSFDVNRLYQYPHSDEAQEAVVKYWQDYAFIEPENVVMTDGSISALNLLVNVFAKPGAEAVMFMPTFTDMVEYSRMMGMKVHGVANSSEDNFKEDESHYLFKRYGNPEDISGLALYLLSDASSWMTGQNIEISGGCPKL